MNRRGGAGTCGDRLSAERSDLGGLRTLLTLLDVERHALTLVEALVSVGLDRGVVHEHVRAATVGSEEAVALLAVEPLDGALCHSCSPRTGRRGSGPRSSRRLAATVAPGSGRRSRSARAASARSVPCSPAL